jgi:acetoin utilization deacetylase AcuC-like enzyme
MMDGRQISQCPMPQKTIPVFYSDRMVASNYGTISPSSYKPSQVVESWTLEHDFPIDLIAPQPASVKQLSLAHDPYYLQGVLAGKILNGFGNALAEVTESLPYTSGSMLSAARHVLKHGGVACSPSSGFHHACYGHGGGFCTFNGLMVAALTLHQESLVKKVGILDCDFHYGNGTDDIIAMTQSPWVRNITNSKGYKGESGRGEDFLEALPGLVRQLQDCDLILYQAGADPHIDDPLGGFLTTNQMRLRDRIVFNEIKVLGIPLVWNLAGGYQVELFPSGKTSIRKVLELHDNTMSECVRVYCGD